MQHASCTGVKVCSVCVVGQRHHLSIAVHCCRPQGTTTHGQMVACGWASRQTQDTSMRWQREEPTASLATATAIWLQWVVIPPPHLRRHPGVSGTFCHTLVATCSARCCLSAAATLPGTCGSSATVHSQGYRCPLHVPAWVCSAMQQGPGKAHGCSSLPNPRTVGQECT